MYHLRANTRNPREETLAVFTSWQYVIASVNIMTINSRVTLFKWYSACICLRINNIFSTNKLVIWFRFPFLFKLKKGYPHFTVRSLKTCHTKPTFNLFFRRFNLKYFVRICYVLTWPKVSLHPKSIFPYILPLYIKYSWLEIIYIEKNPFTVLCLFHN